MEPTTPADPDFSVEWRSRPARSNSDYHCEFLEADDKLRRDVTSPPHSSEPATSHGPAPQGGRWHHCGTSNSASARTSIPTTPRRQRPAGHFARLNTNSSVTPAGARGFVSFISSSVMDVTIRR